MFGREARTLFLQTASDPRNCIASTDTLNVGLSAGENAISRQQARTVLCA